jgi:hypothetical protein
MKTGHLRAAHGAFCGSPFWRFNSFEVPIVAGTSVLPVPEAPIEPELPLFPARSLALFPTFAPAGPTGVSPLLASLLAPLGSPLPALDMPVPPPPAAYAKLGIK